MYMIGQEIFMKRLLASLALAFSLSAPAAFSQTEPRFGIGIAATGQLPVGEFDESAGFGFGGLGGLEFGAYPGLAVTARSGYIQFLEKQDYARNQVPILGGLKASAVNGLYMALEAGAVFTNYEYTGTAPGFGKIADETTPGWNVGVGSLQGPLDFRLSLNVWDAAHAMESMTIGLSVGFTAFSW